MNDILLYIFLNVTICKQYICHYIHMSFRLQKAKNKNIYLYANSYQPHENTAKMRWRFNFTKMSNLDEK
jgi:hypothetical protein